MDFIEIIEMFTYVHPAVKVMRNIELQPSTLILEKAVNIPWPNKRWLIVFLEKLPSLPFMHYNRY